MSLDGGYRIGQIDPGPRKCFFLQFKFSGSYKGLTLSTDAPEGGVHTERNPTAFVFVRGDAVMIRDGRGLNLTSPMDQNHLATNTWKGNMEVKMKGIKVMCTKEWPGPCVQVHMSPRRVVGEGRNYHY